MTHKNSPLTPEGRRRLVERVVVDGRPIAHVATEEVASSFGEQVTPAASNPHQFADRSISVAAFVGEAFGGADEAYLGGCVWVERHVVSVGVGSDRNAKEPRSTREGEAGFDVVVGRSGVGAECLVARLPERTNQPVDAVAVK